MSIIIRYVFGGIGGTLTPPPLPTTYNTKNIVFVGDSLTAGAGASLGYGTTTGTTYPAYSMTAFSSDTGVNLGVGGKTASQMLADSSSQATANFNASKDINIAVIHAGINDLFQGANATTAYNNVRDLCLAWRSKGYKVIVCTNTANNNTSIKANKDQLVDLIRSNWQNFADSLCDLASDSRVGVDGAETDLAYYTPDQLHLADNGNVAISSLVNQKIANLCNLPVPPIVYSLGSATYSYTGTTNTSLGGFPRGGLYNIPADTQGTVVFNNTTYTGFYNGFGFVTNSTPIIPANNPIGSQNFTMSTSGLLTNNPTVTGNITITAQNITYTFGTPSYGYSAAVNLPIGTFGFDNSNIPVGTAGTLTIGSNTYNGVFNTFGFAPNSSPVLDPNTPLGTQPFSISTTGLVNNSTYSGNLEIYTTQPNYTLGAVSGNYTFLRNANSPTIVLTGNNLPTNSPATLSVGTTNFPGKIIGGNFVPDESSPSYNNKYLNDIMAAGTFPFSISSNLAPTISSNMTVPAINSDLFTQATYDDFRTKGRFSRYRVTNPNPYYTAMQQAGSDYPYLSSKLSWYFNNRMLISSLPVGCVSLTETRDYLELLCNRIDTNNFLNDISVQTPANTAVAHESTPPPSPVSGTLITSPIPRDSDDSYTSTTLSLAVEYVKKSGDTGWFNTRLQLMKNFANANLINAFKTNDLIAVFRPGSNAYQAGFLMDNCENYRGLKDFGDYLQSIGDPDYTIYLNAATRVVQGIEGLWNPTLNRYEAVDGTAPAYNGVNADYPVFIANLFPTLCGVPVQQTRKETGVSYFSTNCPNWDTKNWFDPVNYPTPSSSYFSAIDGGGNVINDPFAQMLVAYTFAKYNIDRTKSRNAVVNFKNKWCNVPQGFNGQVICQDVGFARAIDYWTK